MDKHAAHTEADGKSLGEPDGPVLPFTSASFAAGETEHEHAESGENATYSSEWTMITSIEEATSRKRGNKNEKGLSSSDEGDESGIGVDQEMGLVV